MKRIAVIGSGFAGLASAACLAGEGYDVTVFEKNDSAGGRARRFEAQGFSFDMGPSWYWMPGVFENFFQRFGREVAGLYTLKRLDPSYRIYFGKNDFLDVPSGVPALSDLFDSMEPGAGKRLSQFLQEAEYKYRLGIDRLVYKPGLSFTELLDAELWKGIFRLHVFRSLSAHVRSFFRDPRIIQMLEFPVLFLGATPERTPALYSLMNYADMALGTWYPMGGMYRIVEAMVKVAHDAGVQFRYNAPVTRILMDGKAVRGIAYPGGDFSADYVVAAADYHHVEQKLLPEGNRRYGDPYWQSRVLAPSSLIFFLGIGKKVDGLQHHTLFFDQDFGQHAREIYDDARWPSAPQFYVSSPSRTDPSAAPEGCENLFILIPVAPGLQDTEEVREKYFRIVMDRLESLTGQVLRDHIIFKRSYAHNDFTSDYNSFRGNAYGLANTLFQTANFKPRMVNKKARNLFFTGQLTVPGPGVPPSIISGQVVAQTLIDQEKRTTSRLRRHDTPGSLQVKPRSYESAL